MHLYKHDITPHLVRRLKCQLLVCQYVEITTNISCYTA